MKIESQEQLRELYGQVSGRAVDKQLSELEQHSIRFIEMSPFLTLASFDSAGGVDVSPRGGKPGFVKVLNSKQLLIPDAKGNNRIDSLVNIVDSGRAGCLFLIPGMDETLRVNGRAEIRTDSDLIDHFKAEKRPPKSCILIDVDEVFLHCAKSIMRSKLWSPEAKIERQAMPTMGKMISDQLGLKQAPESQEVMLERYQEDL